jgi:hypothetical protein
MPRLIELARHNTNFDHYYEREFGLVFLNCPDFSLHRSNPGLPQRTLQDYEEFKQWLRGTPMENL